MKHSTIENILIYTCLGLAVILIGYVLKESYANKNKDESVIKELESVFEKKEEEEPIKKEKKYIEPNNIKTLDKGVVINKYFDDILNRRKDNEVITYDTLISWGAYEILSIDYVKPIANNYYAYDVNIKIPNTKAIISGRLNEKLSKEDYLVVTIEFDLLLDNNSFIIKNIHV